MASASVGKSFGEWLSIKGYKVSENNGNGKRAMRVHLHSTGRAARSELNKLWLQYAKPLHVTWYVTPLHSSYSDDNILDTMRGYLNSTWREVKVTKYQTLQLNGRLVPSEQEYKIANFDTFQKVFNRTFA